VTICAAVQEMLGRDESSAGYGMTVLSAADGQASVTLVVEKSSANGHGLAHGGLIFGLADTAFACAANSRLEGTVTAGADITYYSPAFVGDTLFADGAVRHLSGRHSLVDVTVRRGSEVIAEYRGRGAIVRPKTEHTSGSSAGTEKEVAQ